MNIGARGASAFTAYGGTLDEFCSLLRELGLSHIELRNFIGDDATVLLKTREQVSRALVEWDLTSTIHAPWRQNLAAAEVPERVEAIVQHQNAIELAGNLGCKQVVIHGGWHTNREVGQDLSLCSIDRLLDTARAVGVRLALENEEVAPRRPTLFQHPSDFKNVDLSSLGFVLDVGHANTLGYGARDFLPVFGARLCEVHLHDNMGHRDEHLAIGDGTVDWQMTTSALASYGELTVVLEHKAVETLAKSARALTVLQVADSQGN